MVTVEGEISASKQANGALVKEIILENFMSYEYARIPLHPGLNLVCGPNGAGKSSILLALAVALGQAYTERSRKLSDLIRRGSETARVTLLFNNAKVKGRSPIRGYDSDIFRLSRYLKRDGTYWYEAEYHEISKAEVTRLLASLGINPDNMLIIMHQNMIEEFSVIPPPQKLIMVEEAVGFHTYRQRILESQERLNKLTSEESSIANILGNAEQTLAYWKEQYEKYIQRMELLQKRSLLESELAWAHVSRLERGIRSLGEESDRKKRKLNRITEKIGETGENMKAKLERLSKLRFERNEGFFTLLGLEKEKSGNEIFTKLSHEVLERLDRHLGGVKSSSNPPVGDGSEIAKWLSELELQADAAASRAKELGERISSIQPKLNRLEEEMNIFQEGYVDGRVKEAILQYQKGEIEHQLLQLEREMRNARKDLEDQTATAEKIGSRIETQRSPQDVSEDLKVLAARLASTSEVPAEAEKMYKNYLNVYNELKEKSEIVSENRQETLKEIEIRKEMWRKVLRGFLNELDETYRRFLGAIDATGTVRAINREDVETAGLELTVGFKGVNPTVLDAYTQSGGERTSAIMAFLLALQRYVKSPIRAVDEFDVHMDPKNREAISRLIASTVKGDETAQYIMITPGHLPIVDEKAHIIMVQNVEGRSETRTVV